MLPLDRMSPRAKAGLMVAVALLLWIPQGISTQTTPMVTGHSVFYNADGYDQCLASVAGMLRSRVMWFNDQILVERYPGKGTYVFVTEAGVEDPTKAPYFVSEGVQFTFTDPNGADWIIYEAYYQAQGMAIAKGPVIPNSNGQVGAGADVDKTYVWFVEIAGTPILDQFPGDDPHSLYNFLVLVDTCKFHRNAKTQAPIADHNATSGLLNDRYGHPNNATPHTHEAWNANIWIGKRPAVVDAADTGDRAVSQTAWAGVTDDSDRPEADGDHRPNQN